MKPADLSNTYTHPDKFWHFFVERVARALCVQNIKTYGCVKARSTPYDKQFFRATVSVLNQ